MKIKKLCWQVWRFTRIAILVFVLSLILVGASIPVAGLPNQVRSFIQPVAFDFGSWFVAAICAKFANWGLSIERFLTPQAQSEMVLNYLDQVQYVNTLNAEITNIYANPQTTAPDQLSQPLRKTLMIEQERLDSLAPMAEAVLQVQLMAVIEESGLGFLGQTFPPSLYQVSDLPQSLVISPRSEIRQIYDVSLSPSISVAFKEELENAIFTKLDHAALVVPIGGIGTYPTMVMQTADLVWLTEVIAHEWVHNFLTLRPLGMNYFTSAELRTINETAATLAGQELGWALLEKFYPQFLPTDVVPVDVGAATTPPEDFPQMDVFNFQAEMRITRVETDRLLAESDVIGAEAYMEARRQFFWENGYPIRKLNQAYFAFYGAYSTDPEGGAAGEDPIGPVVQSLRAQSATLAEFLNTISWVTSYDALQRLLID